MELRRQEDLKQQEELRRQEEVQRRLDEQMRWQRQQVGQYEGFCAVQREILSTFRPMILVFSKFKFRYFWLRKPKLCPLKAQMM